MRGFDPVNQLASREAVRFVGTVGDVTVNAFDIYKALVMAFSAKEIRSADELGQVVQKSTEDFGRGACTPVVARNTVEVAAALRLLSPIPQLSEAKKKFTLGDNGRVILCATKHPRFSDSSLPIVFRRPLFEGAGDYLLQALTAINEVGDRDAQLGHFTRLVRAMVESKVAEVPATRKGISWDVYIEELRVRQRSLSPPRDAATTNPKPTLESLQKERRAKAAAALRGKIDTRPGVSRSSGAEESKTFLHQFSRCRAWLADLNLIQRATTHNTLTPEGHRILEYFISRNRNERPARIPPSAASLKDTFQLSDTDIEQAWGVVVDEAFWEDGLFPLATFGRYSPTADEFLKAVDWAFSGVKVRQVSEAALSPLRQAIFLHFLLNEKPLRGGQLDQLLADLFEKRGDIYGLGRNRQGRPAFVFRKRRSS